MEHKKIRLGLLFNAFGWLLLGTSITYWFFEGMTSGQKMIYVVVAILVSILLIFYSNLRHLRDFFEKKFHTESHTLNIKVKDFMKTDVLTTTGEDTVMDAASKMTARDAGSIIIVDENKKPLGIMTERDLMTKFSATGRSTQEANVAEVMTAHILSVHPNTPLLDVIDLMEDNKIKRVPVVEDHMVVGIISQTDLIGKLGKSKIQEDIKETAEELVDKKE